MCGVWWCGGVVVVVWWWWGWWWCGGGGVWWWWCVGGGGGGGGVWWWYGPLCYTRESVLPRALVHLIRVAEHLGASSRRPRHPFPALMAGVNPGRVPVCTALKKSTRQQACQQPVQETMPTAELPQFLHCLDQPKQLVNALQQKNLYGL